ncbi:MAG: glycine--tRNA ligase subunit beta, partial [Rhodanobacter sp.]
DGTAAPYFGFVANIEPADAGAISIAGNERVLRARFADARHFWDLDRKARLESRVPLLDHVTFHAKLGSQGERGRRLERLAEEIAPLVGAGPALARDAARLAKADLVTGMVGEFPELQGVMGRYYAAHDGEPAEVAEALDSHYRPRFGGDRIAADRLGQVLAVAERLDTLAGIFAIGMKPGGNKDPFALRRAALGLARTLIEGGLELDLRASFIEALEQLPDAALAAGLKPGKDGKPPALQAGARRAILLEDLLDFVHERMRSYYAEQGFEHGAFEAVMAVQPASVADFDRRLRAVVEFGRRPEAASLAAANKRVANILRKQAEEGGAPSPGRAVDPAFFEADAERDLAEALAAARQDSAAAEAAGDYAAVLARLAQLQAPVDAFFDSVLVNVEDPAVRANRLALLNQLKSQFSTVADIALL